MRLPTGFGTGARPAAPALGDWRKRLANALSVLGYVTVDLRPVNRSSFVPLSEAIGYARGQYAGARTDPWTEVANHLATLKVLAVETVALRAASRELHLVPLRVSPDGHLDVAEATQYFGVIEEWNKTLSALLPTVSLNAQEKAAVDNVAAAAKKYADNNKAVGTTAARLLSMLVEANTSGSCETVHPIAGPATAAFRTAWQQADLTSQPFLGIWNLQHLWSISDGAIITCGAGGWETQVGGQWDPAGPTLQKMLAGVTDA